MVKAERKQRKGIHPLTESTATTSTSQTDADAEFSRKRKQDRLERIKKAEKTAELEFVRNKLHMEEILERERKETLCLESEDVYSRRAEQYELYLDSLEASAALAKEKALELYNLRRIEAVRHVEGAMAREKAARIDVRRKKAAQMLHEIETEVCSCSSFHVSFFS